MMLIFHLALMEYYRVLGLDIGTKRIGLALSDPLLITAQPFETIQRKSSVCYCILQ